MNSLEWRAVICLGMVYALRMIGMFMILPVLALYAATLTGGAGPLAIGFAIGVYGLAQAILQVPLGMLSDRIGRKPVIYLGMTLFACGSLIAGLADTIEGVTLGRIIQGAGAVSSAVSALLADVTRDQVRTTAMAILGAGVGLAFVLALIAGPIVAGWIGVDGIFLLTAALALLSLPIVALGVPTPAKPVVSAGGIGLVLKRPDLLRLDAGIFILHAMMTALFLAAPLAIVETLKLPGPEHWKVYAPVLVLSLIPVFPLIRWAEKSGKSAFVFRGTIIVLSVSMLIQSLGHDIGAILVAGLLLYFIGFNYLEGALPSMISRRAPAEARGVAMGVYASSQFLGAFAGGSLGGWAQSHWGITGTFVLCMLLPLIWLLIPGDKRSESMQATVLKSQS